MMPAMRAMPSTSPFFAVPDSISASVAGCISMQPVAMATRCVAGLAPTSTMWAWPWASKWVNGLVEEVMQWSMAVKGWATACGIIGK